MWASGIIYIKHLCQTSKLSIACPDRKDILPLYRRRQQFNEPFLFSNHLQYDKKNLDERHKEHQSNCHQCNSWPSDQQSHVCSFHGKIH